MKLWRMFENITSSDNSFEWEHNVRDTNIDFFRQNFIEKYGSWLCHDRNGEEVLYQQGRK